MIKITKLLLGCIAVLVLNVKLNAQLSGTYNVPLNFPTLAAAISALNVQGVSAPVFIELSAGYTETAPAGGYALTATGTVLNPITFRKTGVGTNPLITASAGGVGTPASAVQDGVWRLIGSDFITIEAIDINDPNAANPSTMEYGYGLFKASTSDGCQNNTIRNCVISLRVINNATGSGPSADGSRGINVVNSLSTSQTTAMTPLSFAGTNSNNKFYGNTISNCNIGIALIGYVAPGPFTLADTGNDVGGGSTVQGNTIINFGGAGAATNPAAGIRTLAQYDLNISYNAFDNNDGTGVNHVNALRGIYVNAATSANAAVTNNTITLKGAGTTAQVCAIENVSGATAANNTISINNNLISNCVYTTNTTGSFLGIYNNAASAAYLDITNNRFTGVNTRATSGANYMIYNTGAVTNTIMISNNRIDNCTNAASTSGSYFMIFNNVVSGARLDVSGNSFDNNASTASTGATHLIYNASATGSSITLNTNTVTNTSLTITSTGAFYGIYNNGASPAIFEARSNVFVGLRVNAFSGASHFVYNTAAAAGSINMSNNVFSACTSSISSIGSFYGVYNNAASSAVLNLSNNTFTSMIFSATSGSVHCVFNRGALTNTFGTAGLNNNLVSACSFSASSGAPFLGIYNSGVTSGYLSLSGNTVAAVSWSSLSSVKYMVFNTGPVTTTLDQNNNLIADCSSTNNTTGTFSGINNAGTCTLALNMCGNTFTSIANSSSTGGTNLILNSGPVPAGIITFTNNAVRDFTNTATGSGDFYGISNNGTTFSTLEVTGNTFSNNIINSFTGATNLIYHTGAVTTSITGINLSNNFISNCTSSVSSTGSFFGIYNNASSCLNLNISNNTFTNNAAYAVNGANHFIYNRGAITHTFSTININDNLISNCTHSASGGAGFYNIWNNGVRSDMTSIRNNTITGSSWATVAALRYLISNWGSSLISAVINNNLISNCTHTNNTTGSLYGIYNNNNTAISSGALVISNNTLTNVTSSATSGETHYINSSGVVTNTYTSVDLVSNQLADCSATVAGTGAFYGLYNNTASASSVNISNNTFTNAVLTQSVGPMHMIQNRGVAGSVLSVITLTGNIVSNLIHSNSSTGVLYGILNAGAATTTCAVLTMNSNTVINTVSSGAGGNINLLHNTCPVSASISISNNLFANLSNSLTATGNFFGIINSGNSVGGDLSIRTNTFSNLVSTASSANRYLVYNSGGVTNSITASDNLITNCSHSITGTGSFHGIYNNGNASAVWAAMDNNFFTNNFSSAVNGNVYLLINSGVASNTLGTVSILNNRFTTHTHNSSAGNFYGILNSGYTENRLAISSNTLNAFTFSSTATAMQLIANSARVTNTISITQNLLSGVSNSVNTSGTFYGIVNTANFANSNFPQNLEINSNRFLSTNIKATSGAVFLINSTGAITNTIDAIVIQNNLVSGVTITMSAGSWNGIYNSAISCGSLTVNNNTLTNIAAQTAATTRYAIFNGGRIVNSASFANNLISDYTSTVNTTGSYCGIYSTGNSQGNVSIANNSQLNISLSASVGTATMIANSGTVAGMIDITNNLVSNITNSASLTGGFVGVYNSSGSSANLSIAANTFTDLVLASSTGPLQMFVNSGPASATIAAVTITSNLVGSCNYTAAGGTFHGIINSGASFVNLSIGSNTIQNTAFTSTATTRYFIYNTGFGTSGMYVNNNHVSGFTSTVNTSTHYYGINNGGSILGDLSITGNTFLSHSLSATSGSAFTIFNSGIVTNSVMMGNNRISGFTYSASGAGGFLGMCNNAATSAALAIQSNTLSNISLYTPFGAAHYITNRGLASSTIASVTMSDNICGQLTFSTTSGTFYGVSNLSSSFANLDIGGNSFSNIVSTSTTSPRYFIYNTGSGSSAIQITSNSVSNYTASGNTTGAFADVLNSGPCAGNLNISGNTFVNQILPSTTGITHAVSNTGAITGSASINTNLISNINHSSTTGLFYPIYSAGAPCSYLSISGNSVTSVSTTNSVSAKYLVYNISAASNGISLSNNMLRNYTAPLNTTGTFAGIYNTGNSQGLFSASGNSISNVAFPSTTGTCYVIYNTGTVSGAADLNNNFISNLTTSVSTSGTFYGLFNLSNVSPGSLSMSGNTFSSSSVSVPTMAVYMVYHAGTATANISSVNLDNNSSDSFTASLGLGTFYGVFNNALPSVNLSMSGNTFTNCVSITTNSPRYMIYNTGSVTGNMNFNNNTIAGYTSSLNTGAGFYGVYNQAFCGGTLDMSGNAFTNNFLDATTGNTYLTYNTGTVANVINMNANTVSGNTNSNITTGEFYAIYNTGSASQELKMNGNSVTNNSSSATTPNTYLIYNTGVISNSISISGNTLGQSFTNTTTDYSGTLYNIYNTGGTSASTLNISGNTFTGYSFTGVTGSGNIYFIYNTNHNKRYDVTGNLWTNISLKHIGNEYLIYNPTNTSAELNVNNNTVSGYTRTANAAGWYGYYSNGSSPATCTQLFSGNNFSNISAGTQGTGSFYGIYNIDGTGSTYPKKQVFNNSISGVNYNGLGFFYGYYFDFLGDDALTGSSVYNNSLTTVSWSGPVYAINIGGNVSTIFAANVYSNTVHNITSTGINADIYGAYLLGGGKGLNFYKNKISDLSSGGLLGTVDGVKVSTSVSTGLYNNMIGNLYTPSSNVANSLNGINIAGGGAVNVYYNTIYINATGTGTAFGSNALFASTSATLDLRNNILVNTSASNGTGRTVAYRRTGASLTNYLSTSDRNLFYAGVPSPTRLLFTDGINSSQILPVFKAFVSPRENNSASESTPFLSLLGASNSFLHIDFGVPSLTESGAQNVGGLTDDFDGQVRQGNIGYAGTGTAPDIGADEYQQNLVPCASASAGTITVPSTTVLCEGQEVYMLSAGYTAAGNMVYQWQVSSTSGGPYTNVTGGSGANYIAHLTQSLTAGTYYYVMTTTCTVGPFISTSNEVTLTVNAAPTASASIMNPTVCAGQDLNFNGGSNIGITYNWRGPNNFTSTAQNPAITGAVTNAGGTYTLLVADLNCTSTPAYVNVTVNPNPPSFTLSPPASSICIGSSQTISASIPITSPTLNFGTQGHQNTASGYPAPYSVYYGGQKMQMLVLAGELAAAGFTAGTPIQSIQFPVVGLGASWGGALNECQNFMVGVKATAVNVLNVFETGISNVVPPTNYTPSVGYNNIHNFSAPFIWDGTSNLVLETVFSNSIVGTAGNAVTQYNTSLGFQSTLVYRADNQNVSAIAAATTSNVNIGFVRPDFKLNGTQVGTYSWSPSTGLSSTNAASVVASPVTSGVYSVELSNGFCTSASTVSLDVILMPTITIASSSPTVCLGNSATLTASGATTYTWSTGIKNASIVVSPFVSMTFTVNGSNPICPSTSNTIFIVSAPALNLSVTAAPPVLCDGGSSTLSASGASTYTWTGGSNSSSIVVSPTGTATYSVLAYDGPGCWTNKTINVKVNPSPTISVSPSTATICLGESVTLEASGVFNFTWTPGNSNSPIFAASPGLSTTYTVLGADQDNCANTATASITVEPCTSVASFGNKITGISIYPNPTSGMIMIESDSEDEKEVSIENSIGALVYSTKINDAVSRLDLSLLARGVYFIRIRSSDSAGTFKLILD